MKKSLLVRVFYIALQGVFLPLVVIGDSLRVSGQMTSWLLFALYEVAIMLDGACLLWILGKHDNN